MQKELFDCMITYGERDLDWYGHYKKGTVIREVVKHNVTREEALAGIAKYCSRIADRLRDGKEVDLPYYREDEVKEYEAECLSCRLALCA